MPIALCLIVLLLIDRSRRRAGTLKQGLSPEAASEWAGLVEEASLPPRPPQRRVFLPSGGLSQTKHAEEAQEVVSEEEMDGKEDAGASGDDDEYDEEDRDDEEDKDDDDEDEDDGDDDDDEEQEESEERESGEGLDDEDESEDDDDVEGDDESDESEEEEEQQAGRKKSSVPHPQQQISRARRTQHSSSGDRGRKASLHARPLRQEASNIAWTSITGRRA